MSQLGPDLGKKWRVFRPKKRVFCPPQRQIRGRLRYKKPPDKAWISSGRTITRAIIRLPGCAMRVLAPLVTKSAARADAKLELPRSQNLELCRCLRNQHGRSRSLPWANTPSTFIGTTAIAAAFIRGNSCAESVRARNVGKRQAEQSRRSALGVQPATGRLISLMKAATSFLLPLLRSSFRYFVPPSNGCNRSLLGRMLKADRRMPLFRSGGKLRSQRGKL